MLKRKGLSEERDKERGKRKLPKHILVLAGVAYFLSLLVAGFDFIAPDVYDISEGMVSPADFNAPRQVENVFLTNLNREAAAAAVPLQFQLDTDINDEILDNVLMFFARAGALRAEYFPILSPFEDYFFDPLEDRPLPNPLRLNVSLDEELFRHMITGDSAEFARFMEALISEVEDSLDAQISTEASLATQIAQLQDELRGLGFDDNYVAVGFAVVSEFLRPNMVVNQEKTQILRDEAREGASVVFFQMGQNIVRAGDIIDAEAYLALNELGIIGTNRAAVFMVLTGRFLAVSIVFVISIFYIYLFMKEMAFNKKQALLLFTLYVMVLVLMRVMAPLPFYFTPVMLFAMLCSILVDMRLSVVLTVAVSVIAVVMNPMNTMFITYALINGIFAAVIAKKIVVRQHMWTAAGAFVLVNALTVMANYFLFDAGFTENALNAAVLSMIGGVMTITITYGSLPLWESLFSVVTQNTLLELTDPNNAILRRLLIETPGTYHHSLIVANLAEAACFDIGANHVLARVGAYYHDIGKMKYPQYFSENQAGYNPHDALPPLTSVKVINEHVSGGLSTARQHKLPQPVLDFIEEHHGTSIMKVFLHKQKMAGPEEDVDEKDFRYNNRIPQSPETAVVMLADTCEAAVRSVFGKGGKCPEEMDAFVRKLIKDRLDDGQLNMSGLSIKDLDTIAIAFLRVFKGMHHERIPYPETVRPSDS
jgi:hypothetical protein